MTATETTPRIEPDARVWLHGNWDDYERLLTMRGEIAPSRFPASVRRGTLPGMVHLVDLWLPILLAAVAVFVVSSVIHMALPIHKGDYQRMPGEEAVMAAMRAQGLSSGEYMFPSCSSMAEMNSPELVAKRKLGPVGFLTVPSGGFAMGKSLLQWFLFSVLISAVVAYLAGLALPRGAAFSAVFRFVGTATMLGYAFGNFTNSIWKGVAWSTSFKFLFDGVIYGLATGAVFGWLWPTVA